MRVAYRGNFSRPFCTEVNVADSLAALGHTVVRLQENQTDWRRCVEAAKGSHLFLWTKTWSLDEDGGHAALAESASAGVSTVSFHLDRYVGLDREEQITHDPFWRTAHVFTADGGSDAKFAEYGVNHHWMPPGMYGPEAHVGKPNRRFRQPVVFVGSYPYPHAEWADYRRELIETVRGHFGDRFAVWPQGRAIRNQELSDLYASAKVVIGDSCLSRGATHYWSDRVPETLGRGALLIHPAVVGMDDWYVDGRDLLTYELGDFGKVVELAEWALANPEEACVIAKQGQATVLARDTYEHRMAQVLETVAAAGGFPEPKVEPKMISVRHRQARRPTPFRVRDGHPTDAQVVAEVWTDDQYRVEREQVRGKTVVDVGANIGAFSVLAASLGASSVHAFEPEPGNAALFRDNVAAWPSVTCHEEALGGTSGDVSLVAGPDGAHGGGTHVVSLNDWLDGAPMVRQSNVNDALRPLGQIGLLKLDCEGSEYRIVDALADDVFQQIERMVGEWHGPLMPHLAGYWPHTADFVRDVWGPFAAKLADYGHVEFHGHPRAGGVFAWRRF